MFPRRALLLLVVLAIAAAPGLLEARKAPPKVLLMAVATAANASSSREDPRGARFGYAPINAIDNEPRTAWCGARQMLGVNEWFEVGLVQQLELKAVGLIGTIPRPDGKVAPEGSPYPYNRVHRVRLENGLGEFRNLEFKDTTGRVEVTLDKPLLGERFKLKIESVYPGEDRALTCIAELELLGHSQPAGAPVDKLAARAIESDAQKVFEEAFGTQRPALAAPRLKAELADIFGRYAGYSAISVTRTLTEVELAGHKGKDLRPDQTACATALRALYDASADARRFLREKYFFKKKLPLAQSCELPGDPLYWALRNRQESIPLFWHRNEYYGLLELGDDRAIAPFLAAYKDTDRMVYRWWEKPAGWHGNSDRSPIELFSRVAGPYARRTLARLIKENEPSFFVDGLRALQGTVGK